jgi:hypothetical protein
MQLSEHFQLAGKHINQHQRPLLSSLSLDHCQLSLAFFKVKATPPQQEQSQKRNQPQALQHVANGSPY